MQKSLPCGANVVQGTPISEARTSIYKGFPHQHFNISSPCTASLGRWLATSFATNMVRYVSVTDIFPPLIREAPTPRLVFVSSRFSSPATTDVRQIMAKPMSQETGGVEHSPLQEELL
ncbi:hypothetical protein HD806DRAFT_539522 [Xylariaceae sp. AK1471]|nr:hypothetical protein HD806DRAFT_539522 [Xylariaceae sp. AK1471]